MNKVQAVDLPSWKIVSWYPKVIKHLESMIET